VQGGGGGGQGTAVVTATGAVRGPANAATATNARGCGRWGSNARAAPVQRREPADARGSRRRGGWAARGPRRRRGGCGRRHLPSSGPSTGNPT
jgi:hypothetical protein